MSGPRARWFMAAAVFGVAAAILAIVFAASGGSKPRAVHTSVISTESAASTGAATSAEQKLIRSLHFVDPSTCAGLPDEETKGIIAKVVCHPAKFGDTADAPENVFVYQVSGSAVLNKVAAQLYGNAPDFSSCNDAPSSTTWSKDGGPTVGSLYCGVGETSGSPIFAWSYDDDGVFAHAQAGKSKPHADLYKWWQSVDVDLG